MQKEIKTSHLSTKMKKIGYFHIGLAMFLGCMTASAEQTMTFFDDVVFYDGYNETIFGADENDGVLRHRNSLYAVKMTDEQLDAFGETTEMNVTIRALCDNYDRIGNINLAFVPKGQSTYRLDGAFVERIELGRFITPFMNYHKLPNRVPYSFQVDYLGHLFHDSNMRAAYDFWLEFELFGIPYAANEQIQGCAGRNDVFAGTLEFVTSEPTMANSNDNVIVPIVMKKPEYQGNNLNNYNSAATDEIGKTEKTYFFTLASDVNDAQIVLITSNHGANANGEEYNRRWHYIYMDGSEEPVLTYKPGRESCEPFRKYNTQANGIYGNLKMSDEEWQSFSNWCPGDVIDNRIIRLGAMKAGEHSVKISVPEAVFPEQQGDIPVSMFFQGLKTGKFKEDAGISSIVREPFVKVSYSGDLIELSSEQEILEVEIYSISGNCIYRSFDNCNVISLAGMEKGIYLLNAYLDNDVIATHKIVRN